MENDANEEELSPSESEITMSETPGSVDMLIERCAHRRPIVVRHTEDPWWAIWRELSRFSAPAVARESLRTLDPTGRSAESLANSVRLADAYFDAYAECDDLIDPVVLYYGCMWLAASVVYSNLPRRDFGNWHHRHGVQRSDQAGSFLDWRVRVVNGTAHVFALALGGDDALDQTFSISDLFCALPELGFHTQSIIGRGSSAIPLYVETLEGDDPIPLVMHKESKTTVASLRLDSTADAEFAEREIGVYRVLKQRGLVFRHFENRLIWQYPYTEQEEINLLCLETPDGWFLQRRLPNGIFLPELSIHLILLHAIGELARYQPDKWVRMHDRYTRDYALIREFIALAERKFPNLILNELANAHFIFQPPTFKVDPYLGWDFERKVSPQADREDGS